MPEYQPGREDIQRIIHDRPVHIELSKNAKGNYQYTISYYGSDPLECLEIIKEITGQLELLYGLEGTRVKNFERKI